VNDLYIRDILLTDWKILTTGLDDDDDPTMSDQESDQNADDENISKQEVIWNQSTTQEKMLEVVRQKFHFAGGCARFLFDVDIKQLRNKLDELCDRVSKW
jgi:hypothetical protein